METKYFKEIYICAILFGFNKWVTYILQHLILFITFFYLTIESLFALRNWSANVGIQPTVCAEILHVLVNSYGAGQTLSLSAGAEPCSSLLFYKMPAIRGLRIVRSILLQVCNRS